MKQGKVRSKVLDNNINERTFMKVRRQMERKHRERTDWDCDLFGLRNERQLRIRTVSLGVRSPYYRDS